MKQLHVFFRIFNDDLNQNKALLPSIRNEYIAYLSACPAKCTLSLPFDELPDCELLFAYYNALLNCNMCQLKEELYQRIFTLSENETEIKQLVKRCQITIKLHLQKIKAEFIPETEYERIFDCCITKDAAGVYKIAYKCLVGLHEFLETTCNDYLDHHVVVPCKLRRRFVNEHREKAMQLLEAIMGFNMDPFIKSQVREVVLRFMEDQIESLTYSRMQYCTTFIKFLDRFLKDPSSKTELEFLKLLVSLDFNRFGVLNYSTDYFRREIQAQQEDSEKLKIIQSLLKAFGQIPQLTNYGYHQNKPSLKSRLLEWLECEEHALLVHGHSSEKAQESKLPASVATGKKLIRLSVPDIALLLRLIHDNKLLGISKAETFKLVSRNFASHKSHHISVKSLSNKYYDVTESSRENIRQVLQKILLNVDSL